MVLLVAFAFHVRFLFTIVLTAIYMCNFQIKLYDTCILMIYKPPDLFRLSRRARRLRVVG